MSKPLYRSLPNACQAGGRLPVAWMDELPSDLIDVVVPPVRFDIQQEFNIVADRSLGLDAQGRVCFCAFRYVRTALRSDDGEILYDAPVYAETVTAWRLPDDRWLASHKVINHVGSGAVVPRLSLSLGMPR